MSETTSDDKALAERVAEAALPAKSGVEIHRPENIRTLAARFLPLIAQHTGPLRERIAELERDKQAERAVWDRIFRGSFAVQQQTEGRALKAEADLAEAVRLADALNEWLGRAWTSHEPIAAIDHRRLGDMVTAFLAQVRPDVAAVGREGEGTLTNSRPAGSTLVAPTLAREEGPGEKACSHRILADGKCAVSPCPGNPPAHPQEPPPSPGEQRHEFVNVGCACGKCHFNISPREGIAYEMCGLPASAPVHAVANPERCGACAGTGISGGGPCLNPIHTGAGGHEFAPSVDPLMPFCRVCGSLRYAHRHDFFPYDAKDEICYRCGAVEPDPVHAVEPPAPETPSGKVGS